VYARTVRRFFRNGRNIGRVVGEQKRSQCVTLLCQAPGAAQSGSGISGTGRRHRRNGRRNVTGFLKIAALAAAVANWFGPFLRTSAGRRAHGSTARSLRTTARRSGGAIRTRAFRVEGDAVEVKDDGLAESRS